MNNPNKTNYLADALVRAVQDVGPADAAELTAQMEDYFSGETTEAAVRRELAALALAGAVDWTVSDGERWYVEAD